VGSLASGKKGKKERARSSSHVRKKKKKKGSFFGLARGGDAVSRSSAKKKESVPGSVVPKKKKKTGTLLNLVLKMQRHPRGRGAQDCVRSGGRGRQREGGSLHRGLCELREEKRKKALPWCGREETSINGFEGGETAE